MYAVREHSQPIFSPQEFFCDLSQVSTSSGQRRNGLEQAAKAFSNLNKVTPENRTTFTSLAKQREDALINEANSMPAPKPSFANRVKYTLNTKCNCECVVLHKHQLFRLQIPQCRRVCAAVCRLTEWSTRSNIIDPFPVVFSHIHHWLLDRLFESIVGAIHVLVMIGLTFRRKTFISTIHTLIAMSFFMHFFNHICSHLLCSEQLFRISLTLSN